VKPPKELATDAQTVDVWQAIFDDLEKQQDREAEGAAIEPALRRFGVKVEKMVAQLKAAQKAKIGPLYEGPDSDERMHNLIELAEQTLTALEDISVDGALDSVGETLAFLEE